MWADLFHAMRALLTFWVVIMPAIAVFLHSTYVEAIHYWIAPMNFLGIGSIRVALN
jgi:hypothetical protein